jgi:hypothetical protein
LIAAIYAGTLFLTLPSVGTRVLEKVFLIALLLQVGGLASQSVKSAIELYRRQQSEKNAEAVTMLSAVSLVCPANNWSFPIRICSAAAFAIISG